MYVYTHPVHTCARTIQRRRRLHIGNIESHTSFSCHTGDVVHISRARASVSCTHVYSLSARRKMHGGRRYIAIARMPRMRARQCIGGDRMHHPAQAASRSQSAHLRSARACERAHENLTESPNARAHPIYVGATRVRGRDAGRHNASSWPAASVRIVCPPAGHILKH